MSQHVTVEQGGAKGRGLEFRGVANQKRNIYGIPMLAKVYIDDHFLTGTTSYMGWLERETDGGTIAAGTGMGGTITITTDGSDDGCAEFYRVAHFSAYKNCGMEARIKLNTITFAGINVGFVDAVHAVDNQINYEITAGAATLVDARATNGAAFVFDTDGTPDVWRCCAVKADAEGTPIAAIGTLAPVADTYANLRVQLDSSGNATFYYNGTAVGYLPACLAYSSTDMLTPYIGFIERSASARILTVDRVTVWQDE